MDVGTVSSDDVISSYRQMLADANHRIAILEAQVVKAGQILSEVNNAKQILQESP
jgi:hypothetical protein